MKRLFISLVSLSKNPDVNWTLDSIWPVENQQQWARYFDIYYPKTPRVFTGYKYGWSPTEVTQEILIRHPRAASQQQGLCGHTINRASDFSWKIFINNREASTILVSRAVWWVRNERPGLWLHQKESTPLVSWLYILNSKYYKTTTPLKCQQGMESSFQNLWEAYKIYSLES